MPLDRQCNMRDREEHKETKVERRPRRYTDSIRVKVAGGRWGRRLDMIA